MATPSARLRQPGTTSPGLLMRLSTETKHSLKTTEFWAMVAVIAIFAIIYFVFFATTPPSAISP